MNGTPSTDPEHAATERQVAEWISGHIQLTYLGLGFFAVLVGMALLAPGTSMFGRWFAAAILLLLVTGLAVGHRNARRARRYLDTKSTPVT